MDASVRDRLTNGHKVVNPPAAIPDPLMGRRNGGAKRALNFRDFAS